MLLSLSKTIKTYIYTYMHVYTYIYKQCYNDSYFLVFNHLDNLFIKYILNFFGPLFFQLVEIALQFWTSIFWIIRMTVLYLSRVVISVFSFAFLFMIVKHKQGKIMLFYTNNGFPLVSIDESGRKIESLYWAWCTALKLRETGSGW